jgi:hypothetical protein
MTDIINFENAQAAKRMGLPLDTKFEERKFRPKTSKLWLEVVRYASHLIGQAYEYANDPTMRRYKRWKRTFFKTNDVTRDLADYAGKLSKTDGDEASAIGAFLTQCVLPFLKQYAELMDALEEDGAEIEFRLTVPDWVH